MNREARESARYIESRREREKVGDREISCRKGVGDTPSMEDMYDLQKAFTSRSLCMIIIAGAGLLPQFCPAVVKFLISSCLYL